MKVASVQHNIVWEDPAATFQLVGPLIDAAAHGGAELISVSEMFSTGFSMASQHIAEPVDGPSTDFLVAQAAKHNVWTCGSIPTRSAEFERPVNQLVVCNSSGVIGRYNKIHPFSYANEDQHYSAGESFLTLTLGGIRTTFFICYDLRFANEFWDTASDTDLFVVVANWPKQRRNHWISLLRARAIENQAYVLATNRVGIDGNGHEYSGDSMLIDPLGELLLTASSLETVLVGDVTATVVADVRSSLPFMADRR